VRINGLQASSVTRRTFVQGLAAGAGGMLVAACTPRDGSSRLPRGGGVFGPLVEDPGGILDLPRGFQYRVLSEEGARLSSGQPVPGDHDGMAAFPGAGGATILVRNHELGEGEDSAVEGSRPYDSGMPGGTTAVVVSPERQEIDSFIASSGTEDNCAGGPTPWGTWLTCEETVTDGHGYVFEVIPDEAESDLSVQPVRGMGLFSHEAAGVDPETGIVYLTEDEGPISFLYRYIPDDRRARPGALHGGGRLQAFAIVEERAPVASTFEPRQRFGQRWIDVSPETPHDDAIERGAVRFNRLEGAFFAGGAFWFNDTAGGDDGLGQTFRYIPAAERLELFFESGDDNQMKSPDNAVITPWGDFSFVEDAPDGNRIMGITPEGKVYELGFNRLNDSELAGPCFTADGQTMFVNIQDPGMTLAIWGRFPRGHLSRQIRMGLALPPSRLMAPQQEISEAALRYQMSYLQILAYERLGVPLE
jgi:secreted PhoX family phosphatase